VRIIPHLFMHTITIGSRGSDLALWQANFIKDKLATIGVKATIAVIKTQGDRIQDLSFEKMEGKGFFTKELETALLESTIDLAVHSHKDLETVSPDELIIGAVSQRENPCDVLLINNDAVCTSQHWHLKKNSRIGTSSARRKAQLIAHREDLHIQDIRGNVPTRIQKLQAGHFDAIIIAQAGIKRLNIDTSAFHSVELSPSEFVPAPAQGVLGIQIRKNDRQLFDLLAQINDIHTQKIVEMERQVLRLMDGGCQLPLGVYCQDMHTMYVAYAKKWQDGAQIHHYHAENLAALIPEIVHILKTKVHERTAQ